MSGLTPRNRGVQPPVRRAYRMLPAAAVVGSLCLIALSYRAAADLCWGVTHGWRVVYGDVSLRAPFGWRQERTLAEPHALALRNFLRAVPWNQRPDRILIHEAQDRFLAEEMAVRWQRLETQRLTPGDRLEPAPTDPFLQEHYRCSNVLRSRDGPVSVTCFDRGGRWIVSLRGGPREIADLSELMQSIASSVPR